MLRKLFITLVLVLSFSSPAWSDDAKDDTFDGTWLPESAELGGKMFPDEVRKTIKLEIKGDKYTVTVGKEGKDEGTVKLMPSETPKAMDITGTNGPNKGKTFLAIYELKGDTLRLCYDLSGKKRPTEFKTSEGTLLFLVEYKRQKK
ncbi:MAG TPA: TIGR03067 domain-containing protein [Gemmataceae bacterium]|jgi:uncharacterized protein (TIGR03067 family)